MLPDEGRDPDPLQRWFSQDTEVRTDPLIGEEVIAFVTAHGARSVNVANGIIGCPHEEGIDYPSGSVCPYCPYWAGHDRWAAERIP